MYEPHASVPTRAPRDVEGGLFGLRDKRESNPRQCGDAQNGERVWDMLSINQSRASPPPRFAVVGAGLMPSPLLSAALPRDASDMGSGAESATVLSE